MPSWLEQFKAVNEGQEPGVTHSESHREKMLEAIVGKPKVYTVGGQDVDFFTVGQLAKALGRKPVTIRKWEADGIIPVTWYHTPSNDARGRRRLYTRTMVEGIIQIAKEEEILVDTWRSIRKTHFQARVRELFERLLNEN